jgi:hypothetical protein
VKRATATRRGATRGGRERRERERERERERRTKKEEKKRDDEGAERRGEHASKKNNIFATDANQSTGLSS